MRTERVSIEYRLTFESAFHLGTGMRAGLIDRLVARDAAGFLYVPGSTVKGVLRERCEQLAALFGLQVTSPHVAAWREANQQNADIAARIFGTRFSPGDLYFDGAEMIEEDRRLFEADGEAQQAEFKARQVEHRTQVSLSRRTRTAQPGMLYTSEYGIRDLRFEGRIVGVLNGFAPDGWDRGTYCLLLLLAGLKSLERIGGSKSSGAGNVTTEILACVVDDEVVSTSDMLSEIGDLEYYWLHREEVQS